MKNVCIIINYEMTDEFFDFLHHPDTNYFVNFGANIENSLTNFIVRFYYNRKYKKDYEKLSKKEQSKITSEWFKYYQDKKTDKIYKKQITSTKFYQPLEPHPEW